MSIWASFVIFVFQAGLVNSRKSPCKLSEEGRGKSLEPLKHCPKISDLSAAKNIRLTSPELQFTWDTTRVKNFLDEHSYLVRIDALRSKKATRIPARVYCMRITVHKSEKPETSIQMTCQKKFLRKRGIITITDESRSRGQPSSPKKIIRYYYRFRNLRGRKKRTQPPLPKATTISPASQTPKTTCSTWKPTHVRRFLTEGGVNVTACPRDPRFHRMEFGLYNVHLEKMVYPFQTPKTCWAFFPNITEGEYQGTVQLRGCRDCPLYHYTQSPCRTTRFHSRTFSVVGLNTTSDIPSHSIASLHMHTLALPVDYEVTIIVSSCGSFAFLVICFLLLYFCIKGTSKKCNDKDPLDSRYNLVDPEGVLVTSKNNKMLVLYQADDENHLNAVQSFCKVMELCGKDVVLDRQQKRDIRKYNKEGWTKKQIEECGVIVVVLSEGLLRKCQEMRKHIKPPTSSIEHKEMDDPFHDMSAIGLMCIGNSTVFRKKTIIFVSFGYGMKNVVELSNIFPSIVKNVHSVIKDAEFLPTVHSRSKRSLTLQTLLPYLEIEYQRLEAINTSDAATEFLHHVSIVMDRQFAIGE